MSSARQRPKADHLVVHRLTTPLPFGELAAAVERCLADHPGLGLFPDPDGHLIRVGGLGLRGDFLIRRTRPGEEGRLLAASRHGDRGAFAAFIDAMAEGGHLGAGEREGDEGLALLDFLQGDVLFDCARFVVIGPRALEDAFSCRFDGLDRLRLLLADLNGEAMLGIDEVGRIECDGGPRLHDGMPPACSLALHEGRRVWLSRVERLGAGGRTLCLRARMIVGRRRYLIGSLSEEG